MLLQDVYHGQPELLLRIRRLGLHVTNSGSHDLLVLEITNSDSHDLLIHMNTHSGPVLHPLDMVKHDPFVLKITAWLHLPDKANSTSLTREDAVMDVVVR
jgi:hypothetical protein